MNPTKACIAIFSEWLTVIALSWMVNLKSYRIQKIRVEAVTRGYADWNTDENGYTHWAWKEITESTPTQAVAAPRDRDWETASTRIFCIL